MSSRATKTNISPRYNKLLSTEHSGGPCKTSRTQSQLGRCTTPRQLSAYVLLLCVYIIYYFLYYFFFLSVYVLFSGPAARYPWSVRLARSNILRWKLTRQGWLIVNRKWAYKRPSLRRNFHLVSFPLFYLKYFIYSSSVVSGFAYFLNLNKVLYIWLLKFKQRGSLIAWSWAGW